MTQKKARAKKSIYETLSEKISKEVLNSRRKEKLDVGGAVRAIRLDRGLKGIDLCKKSKDLDPRTLTALEKGRIKNPSVKTLQSVARGLDMSVGDLFRQVEMGFDRCFFYQGSQKGAYQVQFPSEGVKAVSFTPFIEDFFCGKLTLGARKRITEDFLGHPFPIYIAPLVGRFEVSVEGKKISLKEGENLFFNGIFRHSFYNPLQRESVLMLITTPSFFKRGTKGQ